MCESEDSPADSDYASDQSDTLSAKVPFGYGAPARNYGAQKGFGFRNTSSARSSKRFKTTIPITPPIETIETLHELGTFTIIVSILSKWYTDVAIQEVGIRALREVGSSTEPKISLASAIAIVELSMRNFPNNDALQIEGCKTLSLLFDDNDCHITSKKLRRAFLKNSKYGRGVHLVVQAMKLHSTNQELQLAACVTLESVSQASTVKCHKQIVASGALGALSFAIRLIAIIVSSKINCESNKSLLPCDLLRFFQQVCCITPYYVHAKCFDV